MVPYSYALVIYETSVLSHGYRPMANRQLTKVRESCMSLT